MKLPVMFAGINWEVAGLKLLLLLLFGASCYVYGTMHEKAKQAGRETSQAYADRDEAIQEINKRITDVAEANKANQAQEITIKEIGRAIDEAIAKHPTTGCNLSPDELRAFQASAAETSAILSRSGLPKPK